MSSESDEIEPDEPPLIRSMTTGLPLVHGSKRWLGSLFPNLRDAAIRWSEDDAGSLSAAVAYYLALSLFPMMLLLTSGIGLFLRFTQLGQDAQQKLLSTVASHGSTVIEQQVEQVLNQLQNQSVVGGPFGVLTAVLAAIGVFAQLDRGFDRVWRIQPKRGQSLQGTLLGVLRHRMFAFLMLLCLGGMLVSLFVANMVFSQVRSIANNTVPSLNHLFDASQVVFVVSANALLFTMVYRWLPKKPVGWSEAFRGGLLAAIIWELGRFVLGVFLIGMRYTSAYGVIGSFIAILLWCYYGMSIVFFGAEYVQVLQLRRLQRESASSEPIQQSTTQLAPPVDSPDASAVTATTVVQDFESSRDGNRREIVQETNAGPRVRPRMRRE